MGKVLDTRQCPQCLDTGEDNLAVYEDGSHCHACGYNTKQSSGLKECNIVALPSRKLTEDTCRFYNIQIGKYTGPIGSGKKQRSCNDEWVIVFNYFDTNGKIIAQKIRTQNKEMKILGNGTNLPLYGSWKFQPNDKLFIVITEGEFDAPSIAQVQGCQYPVVSLPNGAQSARKSLEENLPWLLKFKYVVLAFDNDEAGNKATQSCLPLFEPGRVKCATMAYKDANEMLCNGKEKELQEAIYRAKIIEPPHLVTVSDVIDKVLIQPKFGLPYPWPSWTKMTFGMRFNEITTLVGPSGAGKTEIIKDLVSHFINDMNVGVFSFEQSPADTIRRYVGSQLGLKLQKPGETWEPEVIKQTAMKFNDKLFLYDFDGSVDITDIFNCIRFLNKVRGCKLFVIDNLKSLRIVLDKEQCAAFAVGLKALMKSLDAHTILVSHVNKDGIRQSTHVGFSSKVEEPHSNLDEEKIKQIMNKFKLDWENGRMPTGANIEGGNDIEAISDYVVVIGRNKQAQEEKERRTIHVKFIKEGRIDSDQLKKTFDLYRTDSGKLEELNSYIPNVSDITPF